LKSESEYSSQTNEIPPSLQPKSGQAIDRLINPKLNPLKRNDDTHHTLSDDFIYNDWQAQPKETFLFPSMAGITKPDPLYKVDRRTPTRGTKRLYVMEYVTSGQGYISYNGILKKVTAGDFYLLTPGFNGFYYSDPKNPFTKKWVNIAGDAMNALAKLYEINIQVFVLHHDMETYFDQIFEVLSNYNKEHPEDNRLKLFHILVNLFDSIARHKEENKDSITYIATINDITKYIEENLMLQRIDIPHLASKFFVCERTVHRMFKKEYNMSPNQYITSRKIGLAQKLLLEDYPVEKVSAMLKFNDPEYFRKVFIKICGVSPQKYKKITVH